MTTTKKKAAPARQHRSTVDIGSIVAAVSRGDLDGDLVTIAQAVQHRVVQSGVLTQWRVKLDDIDVVEADLTLDEWDRWARSTEGSWQLLKPLQSPATAIALMTVLFQTRSGLSADEAEERARSITAAAIVEALSEEPVADPLDRPSPESPPPGIS